MNYSDSKITDLVKVIGEVTSENFSPTLRAKLVGINEYAGMCMMEVVESPYKLSAENNHRAGERYHAPIYRIHNAFFF
jgi:hypothetical protein